MSKTVKEFAEEFNFGEGAWEEDREGTIKQVIDLLEKHASSVRQEVECDMVEWARKNDIPEAKIGNFLRVVFEQKVIERKNKSKAEAQRDIPIGMSFITPSKSKEQSI